MQDTPQEITTLRSVSRVPWTEFIGAAAVAARATKAPFLLALASAVLVGGIAPGLIILCWLPVYLFLSAVAASHAFGLLYGSRGKPAVTACAALDEGLLLLGLGFATFWRWESVTQVRSGWWGVMLFLRGPAGVAMAFIRRGAWPSGRVRRMFTRRAHELRKIATQSASIRPPGPAPVDTGALAKRIVSEAVGQSMPESRRRRPSTWVAMLFALFGAVALVGVVVLCEPRSPAPRGPLPPGIYPYNGAPPRGPVEPRTFTSSLTWLWERCVITVRDARHRP